jgi:hypothetical protein
MLVERKYDLIDVLERRAYNQDQIEKFVSQSKLS